MCAKSFPQQVEKSDFGKTKLKKCPEKAEFFVEKTVEKVEKHLYKMVLKKWKTCGL